MIKFNLIPFQAVPWERLSGFSDRIIFQTREWLNFVAETQGAKPIVAEVRDESGVRGYFSGLIIRRFGVKILGSSFPGWTTAYMGFNLDDGLSRAEVLKSFPQWVYGELGCLHFEVSDRLFVDADAQNSGLEISSYDSYRTDLTQTEDEIFAKMDSACRRCIRKAEKGGVVIEESSDAAFAEEYYAQLADVFAKQQRTPTYDLERVRSLVRNLQPTGSLLLLRARTPDGLCIGTGIYPGLNDVAYFWGNASWREHQNWRPNEALHWYALRYWKARGVKMFDWGGGGEYKEKYGVEPLRVPWFIGSRFKILSSFRHRAKSMYYSAQRVAGKLKKIK